MSDRTIPAIRALGERVYVVASGRDGNLHIHGRYANRDVAVGVCNDLNLRYGRRHFVAKAV